MCFIIFCTMSFSFVMQSMCILYIYIYNILYVLYNNIIHIVSHFLLNHNNMLYIYLYLTYSEVNVRILIQLVANIVNFHTVFIANLKGYCSCRVGGRYFHLVRPTLLSGKFLRAHDRHQTIRILCSIGLLNTFLHKLM